MGTTWLHSSKRDDAELSAVYVRKETHPQSRAHHLSDLWELRRGDWKGSMWDADMSRYPVPYYWHK